ncbi:MAG: PHP domain-containing protein [SAR202 cluster bacterium]|nr:PHP domain-containing protein [SAR202 cluster bacterium]
MPAVDLHLHTTASDGRLTPTQLVDLLAQRGVEYAAITDHDSTEGMAEALEAARRHPTLRLIPGIELSADHQDTEVHVLGYFLNWRDQRLQSQLQEFRRGRVDRARTMVDKLADLGLPIDWPRVQAIAGEGAVGRPHIALAMVEKGYVKEVREAFDKYLGRSGPAYAERQKLKPVDAVALIRKAGGAAVLAHPTWVNNVEARIEEMLPAGLAGMEVYYGVYSPETMSRLASIAQKYGLIACGGSDYHALGNPDEALPGYQGPPESAVDALKARASPTDAQIRGRL